MTKPANNSTEALTALWAENYKTAPVQLNKMKEVKGLISAFNANIDAVIKISGKTIESLIGDLSLDHDRVLKTAERKIESADDVLRGVVHCFRSGIAEEWLVENKDTFNWLNRHIGYDKLQMGGQGGIVANVMAVCGVNPVFVHCASLPEKQARLFLDRPNLQTVDQEGKLSKAYDINRKDDIPLIHWIIEFDKGDVLEIGGELIECPKSNRFIATYDPLNFKLHIDEGFARAMSQASIETEIIVLSGYQMLMENLADGTPGTDRIDQSIDWIRGWKKEGTVQVIHLEMASTQDRYMRKYLLDTLAREVDSLGFNERELIDLLEVMGELELAARCEKETSSANLFEGMLKLFAYTDAPRLQLHMFGLYLTLQKKGFKIDPVMNRNGMQLAAVIAAAKAGTGSINSEEVLLWASNSHVSLQGLKELSDLSGYMSERFGDNNIKESGIFQNREFELIAVPTILIDKPVTLVGMGDTISSISLVGAR